MPIAATMQPWIPPLSTLRSTFTVIAKVEHLVNYNDTYAPFRNNRSVHKELQCCGVVEIYD